MPKRLPVPPDLQHLIEKRDEPERRRATRRTAEQTTPIPAQAAAQTPADRRSGKDRRKKDRRQDSK